MTDPGPATAYFQRQGGSEDERLPVHFNPASLRVSLTNQFGDDPPEQHARPTTTKLDVELIFDTTETGMDVRTATAVLRSLATATATAPAAGAASGGGAAEQANHSLPKVVFHWGTADYIGVIESLTETLDYWSSDGVPLRATIQVAMKGSSLDFLSYTDRQSSSSRDNPVPALSDVTPAPTPTNGKGATDTATKGGDPKAGRGLAAANGLESMRAPGGASIGASAGVSLSAAASFKMSGGISAGASAGFGIGAAAGASASAGIGASVGVGMAAGAGIGVGGGIGIGGGIGASAGAGIGGVISLGTSSSGGLSASASMSVTGLDGVTRTSSSTSGSSSAGLTAAQGAFAGLGTSKTTMPSASFDPGRFLPPPAPAVGPGAQFDKSGKLTTGNGQVAATYEAQGAVTFF